MLNEYKNLHNLTIFGPQYPAIMSWQKWYRSLQAVNIIKDKRYSNIKGRTCVDKSLQWNYVPHEEAMSPNIALEALFASLLIDAYEGRAV